MAERVGPRLVTQRRFEDVTEAPLPEPPPAPEVVGEPSGAPERRPIERIPSDLALRERQRKWVLEREGCPHVTSAQDGQEEPK